MPIAKPPQAAVPPAPLTAAEALYIKATIARFYGPNAVVRTFGPDPKRLCLHVETTETVGMEQHECLGLLMCEIVRDYISLDFTKPGARAVRSAKIAYRQGVVL